ncbi:MAG: ATP-binding protein [Steroidobacteraceae bacterium]
MQVQSKRTRMADPEQVAPSDLAWRVIGLLNLFRLLIPPALYAIYWFTSPQPTVGDTHPRLFVATLAVYFAVGVALVLLKGRAWLSLRALAFLHASIDSIAIAIIMFASGGVASGLGILLVVPIGATVLLAAERDALFIAAIAAVAILLQQIYCQLTGSADSHDYPTAGVLGAVLFLISVSVWPISNRLRQSEALVRKREVDLANLAQLSQYIVQRLRESILVVDHEDRIRLINESAAQILGDSNAFPGALLGEASPKLLYLLSTWRAGESAAQETAGTFVAADGARIVEPHFAALGSERPSPVIVFLEDTSLLATRVQQSKLASLGRLSASIAHEIRNPVGAIGHAAQLLAESPDLPDGDRRLADIVVHNCMRVSDIIDNVLSLSRRNLPATESITLRLWLNDFRNEFAETMQCDAAQIALVGPETTPSADIELRTDPGQLRQILWNLGENALKYGVDRSGQAAFDLRYGYVSGSARVFVEVSDRGPGIAGDLLERIFEPFFSSGTKSSGLGLFIARELAEVNGATLLYEPRGGGGSTFRLVFPDPSRWSR